MFKAIMKKRSQGFTLVELMIVVAIIGVLAALAIYGVARYLKHTKTAEATRSLGAIENGQKNNYQLETETTLGSGTFFHVFADVAGPTPAAIPTGTKVKTAAADWDAGGWPALKFSMNEPQFYSYTNTARSGEGTGASYTATALGDLDGDSVASTFQIIGQGSITGDASRTSLTIANEDE